MYFLPAIYELIVKSKHFQTLNRVLRRYDFGYFVVVFLAYYFTYKILEDYAPNTGMQLAYFPFAIAIISGSVYETLRVWIRMRRDQFVDVFLNPRSLSLTTTQPRSTWGGIIKKRWLTSYILIFIPLSYSINLFYDGYYVESITFTISACLAICSFLLATRLTFELTRIEEVDAPELQKCIKKADLKLPKRVCRGNTHNIYADVEPILDDETPHKYLTVELQAAGLVVNGDLCQKKPLGSESKMRYRWNCYFPNLGTHTINIAFKRHFPDFGEREILAKTHDVKVVRRYRELWPPILTSLIPTIPFWPQIIVYFLHY
jgi:hypothetical protein